MAQNACIKARLMKSLVSTCKLETLEEPGGRGWNVHGKDQAGVICSVGCPASAATLLVFFFFSNGEVWWQLSQEAGIEDDRRNICTKNRNGSITSQVWLCTISA